MNATVIPYMNLVEVAISSARMKLGWTSTTNEIVFNAKGCSTRPILESESSNEGCDPGARREWGRQTETDGNPLAASLRHPRRRSSAHPPMSRRHQCGTLSQLSATVAPPNVIRVETLFVVVEETEACEHSPTFCWRSGTSPVDDCSRELTRNACWYTSGLPPGAAMFIHRKHFEQWRSAQNK